MFDADYIQNAAREKGIMSAKDLYVAAIKANKYISMPTCVKLFTGSLSLQLSTIRKALEIIESYEK